MTLPDNGGMVSRIVNPFSRPFRFRDQAAGRGEIPPGRGSLIKWQAPSPEDLWNLQDHSPRNRAKKMLP